MVEVRIEGDKLNIHVLGWSKIWALKNDLEVPLERIKEVKINDEAPKGFWLRWPGTALPGVIRAGSYTDLRNWAFFDIRNKTDNVLTIETNGWDYRYVVVEVANAKVARRMINAAMNPRRRTNGRRNGKAAT